MQIVSGSRDVNFILGFTCNDTLISDTLRKWSIWKKNLLINWGADKSLARPGRKQATATEDFEFHVSYL